MRRWVNPSDLGFAVVVGDVEGDGGVDAEGNDDEFGTFGFAAIPAAGK